MSKQVKNNTSTSSVRAKNKLVPNLRFPEFQKTGEWQRTTIGEVGTFYYGKGAPKWSLTSDAPTLCVRYGELYTKFDTIISEIVSRTNIDPSNLRFSKGGEILIPRVGEVPQDFAKNCCYLPFPNIAIGEMISVYETEEYPIFYAYYFRTMSRQFAQVVEGQNVKNLYYVNLEPIIIGKPSFLEQQKIANCLSSLDNLITAENQKLVELKAHKKGLMQNLFPAEGETVPNLRFKEFENSEEWEVKILGQVAHYDNGKAHEQEIDESGSYVVVNSKFISSDGEIRKYSNKAYCLAEKGDILMVLSDVPNGKAIAKCFFVDSENLYTVNQRVCKIKAHSAHSLLLYFILNRNQYFLAFDDGVKQTNLRNDDVLKCPFLLPRNPLEQQKIADCLSSLDDLITAQSQKIEALKEHKKGLMQGLFPNITEID